MVMVMVHVHGPSLVAGRRMSELQNPPKRGIEFNLNPPNRGVEFNLNPPKQGVEFNLNPPKRGVE